jgi:hypothetical protein
MIVRGIIFRVFLSIPLTIIPLTMSPLVRHPGNKAADKKMEAKNLLFYIFASIFLPSSFRLLNRRPGGLSESKGRRNFHRKQRGTSLTQNYLL